MHTPSHSCAGGQAYGYYSGDSDQDKDETEFLMLWQNELDGDVVYDLVEVEAK